jgi:hypothetical protein
MIINGSRTVRLGAAILLVAVTCAAASARQSSQRVIGQALVETSRQSPVVVVAVKVKGEPVVPGRPFAAGDDWLLGLTFRLKNVSDRPISYVEIGLRFPAAAGHKAESVHIVGPVAYGCYPGYPCRPDVSGSSKEILPGETRDVGLRGPESLMAALSQVGALLPVQSAEYDIDSVLFDADTRWSRGLLFRRDPSEPNTFRMAGKYVLPEKPE